MATYTGSDTEEELASALRLSQQLPGADDEQAAQALSQLSASTPPNQNDDDDLELALTLSQLPAEIFDEQVGELNREARGAAEGASSAISHNSHSEVRTRHHPHSSVNQCVLC
jgi:hypothetical protein